MIRKLTYLLPALALLLLVACGQDDTASPTEAVSNETATNTEESAAPTSAPVADDEPAATEVAPTATTAPEPAATEPEATEATPAEAEATAEPTAATSPVVNEKLDLNTVTEDQLLATIPNFGNRMVREFFEYRPYISIAQFRREIGKYVDDAQIAEYELYVYLPIDVDNADAATVAQIPGLDEAQAEALIAGRPFGSNEAFLAALAEYLTPEQVAVAAGYLAQP
ncbi:MAG: hypothetical protein KDE59_16355 [Anaerolineales bacterium]|nr:hypothetical protein [Anaerolineales bacterium]